MKLILLGAPGAGKGTLAALLASKYNIPHISTGDIFRKAVKDGTPLGKKVQAIMERGELVPDELTIDLIKERLSQNDVKSGFMLDGFPRTLVQAKALSGFVKIDAALNLICTDDIIIQRLSGRRLCKKCGKIFHITNMPPKVEGRCDNCGGPLYIRDDDKIESIKQRLSVYQSQTEPLINYYLEFGLLKDVDSTKTPEVALKEAVLIIEQLSK
jgi:adenylate kinase